MANAPKTLYRGQPGVASTTLYTAPAATTAIITHIAICNISVAAASFSLANVASGGSEDNTNRFMYNANVYPGTTLYVDLAMVLETGASLRATASVASTLTFVVSGVAVT